MSDEDRAQAKAQFFDWCREMRNNAEIALAGTEAGARLILNDPAVGQLDITDLDAAFNQRAIKVIELFFAAEGVSVVA